MITAAAANGFNPLGTLLGIIAILALAAPFVAFYFLPAIIAKRRKAPDFGVVMVLNVLGFFVLTWFIALIMAFRDVPARQDIPRMLP